MNKLEIFENNEFGKVRTILIKNKPYFVGNDIARPLGYKNPRKAISDHCKGVTKHIIPTKGGKQEINVIPEADVYKLISKSCLVTSRYKQELIEWLKSKGYLEKISLSSRDEVEFINKLQKLLKPFELELLKQYRVLDYRLDGYIEEINIAIEYDEEQHNWQREADNKRQKEIEEELKCKFIRVDSKDGHLWNCGYVLKNILKIKGEI